MRGQQKRSSFLFSYVSIEEGIPASHPLSRIRRLADPARDRLNPTFCRLYASDGRPSVPPEQLAALLRKAELNDAQEDERYGKDKRGDELPPELQRQQEGIKSLRKARAALEAEAAADHARQRQKQAK